MAQYGTSGSTITLSGGAVPAFQMFQTRYNSQNSSLPVWTFNVADNFWGEANIVLEAKLTRGATLLVDWFTVAGPGSGFNRSVKVSDGLHADVAKFSGRFTFTLRARDGFGNQSAEAAVQWDQTIRTPPLRQRIDAVPCSCSDPKCVTHYSLGQQSGTCSPYSFKAAGLFLTQVRAAAALVDNPNPVPIQFILIGDLTASARHGMDWKNPVMADPGGPWTCDERGLAKSTPQNTCYSVHAGGEFGTTDVLSPTDLLAGYDVAGATYLGQNASGWPVYEIPPNSTAMVFMLSAPWTFLLPHTPTDYPTYGNLPNVVGWQETRYSSCSATLVNPDGEVICIRRRENGALLQWTRGTVFPNGRVSVNNRVSNGLPLSDATSWTQRVGTNLDTAQYNGFNWASLAPGYQ